MICFRWFPVSLICACLLSFAPTTYAAFYCYGVIANQSKTPVMISIPPPDAGGVFYVTQGQGGTKCSPANTRGNQPVVCTMPSTGSLAYTFQPGRHGKMLTAVTMEVNKKSTQVTFSGHSTPSCTLQLDESKCVSGVCIKSVDNNLLIYKQ